MVLFVKYISFRSTLLAALWLVCGASSLSAQTAAAVNNDTLRAERPHSGTFEYPARRALPARTGSSDRAVLLRNKPPFLAIKTNLVWGATLTPNLAAEIGLGRRTSIEIAGGYNRWSLKGSNTDNRKFVHRMVKSEFRYWLCERFNGFFFGAHAFYGNYNVGGWNIPLLFDKAFRYQGDVYGGGLSLGYHWIWSERWGMEFTAGVGAARLDYTKSECEKCGLEVGRYTKNYFGPTSAGIKLIFVIK